MSVVPASVTIPIADLCARLVRDGTPVYVDVRPAPGATPTDCFINADAYAREHGGSVLYGWQIWEWPDTLLEAEFHAVWRSPGGELVDVTPKVMGCSQILFLANPSATYEGRQVENVYHALSGDRDVEGFIELAHRSFEALNRGELANCHGPIELEGEDAQIVQENRRLAAELMCRAAAPKRQPDRTSRKVGRNEPCPCGSGLKYKKCCGHS